MSILSNPQKWIGSVVSTLSGPNVNATYTANLSFTINVDGTIQGTLTGQAHSNETFDGGSGSAAAPSVNSTVTGNFNAVANTVNLIVQPPEVGPTTASVTGKSGSAQMQGTPGDVTFQEQGRDGDVSGTNTMPGNGTDYYTFTQSDGSTTSGSTPVPVLQTVTPGTTVPPIALKSGASVTITNSLQGVTVTAVVTIYPAIVIVRQDRTDATFLSTDTLDFKVTVNAPGYDPNSACWVVQGESQDSGNGNPSSADNTPEFSFTPNPTNRPGPGGPGSLVPNDPIKYQVQVTVSDLTTTMDLEQDETDIMRQEYVDYGTGAPDRGQFVAPSNPAFNSGNYSLILDGGMAGLLAAITQYCEDQVQASLTIRVSCGYRNPQHNRAIGSLVPTRSYHMWGRALDIVVSPASAVNWQILHQAGAASATKSFCEHGHVMLDSTAKHVYNPSVDHVHIQWGPNQGQFSQ
jgi:hypothetical protein